MTPKEIIERIKNIRDAFANGVINSEGIIEHIDDLVLDVRDRSDGFSNLSDDGDYYKSFEKTDFTKLDL